MSWQRPSWDWPELCDVKIKHDPRFSRVFPYEDLKSHLLDRHRPAVADPLERPARHGRIRGDRRGGHGSCREDPLGKEPKHDRDGGGPRRVGDGHIVFAQLDIQRRVDRSQDDYDPVAERVLLNLLSEAAR